MKKTNKKKLEEFIRVDHAGERGAIKIYEGQLLALKTFKKDPELLKLVEEMREHEQEHSDFFENEIRERNIKPTKFLPLWDLLGVGLGLSLIHISEPTRQPLISSAASDVYKRQSKNIVIFLKMKSEKEI